MGRYDQLGGFLTLGLIMLFPWLYYFKKPDRKLWWVVGMIVGALALVLTMSRASWIAAFLGMAVVGIVRHRDRRVYSAVGIFFLALIVYLAAFIFANNNVRSLTERPNQTLAERIVEAGSFGAWRASYEGYGRFFFIVNTPLLVVARSPLFGVGPGNYGGGAAAALVNTAVYDRLHLPFGIEGVMGQIDNNWLSIWGEVGTIGLFAWVMIFAAIYRSAAGVAAIRPAREDQAMADGVAGLAVGIAVIGFFGPYFEFRSLMFYFWLAVGAVLLARENKLNSGNFLK